MPARALIAWQHLTGANNVVRYLAACEAAVVVAVPSGRATTSKPSTCALRTRTVRRNNPVSS